MKTGWLRLFAALFAAAFLFSAAQLLLWYRDSRDSRLAFSQVEELREAESGGITGRADAAGSGILGEYYALYRENPDLVGWVSIEGTDLSYPVMQTPEDPDFYLKHDFSKQENKYGVPYLQADCDLTRSDNLIVYGHHMQDGSMFSALCQYTSADFYAAHPTIRFDTIYSYGSYEVLAVFKTSGGTGGFHYYEFVDAADAAEFDDYVAACKKRSLYSIETTAAYGDRLLTLSTCEYSRTNGRMVVVAKLLTDEQ